MREKITAKTIKNNAKDNRLSCAYLQVWFISHVKHSQKQNAHLVLLDLGWWELWGETLVVRETKKKHQNEYTQPKKLQQSRYA